MNVVLSIESIRPPLTGIGRYSWELATRLSLHEEISSLRFMSDGLWCKLPIIDTSNIGALTANSPSTSSSSLDVATSEIQVPLNYKGQIRKRLSQIQIFSLAYSKLKPMLASHQLRATKNGIFHGPNYFIPQSQLTSVVTIHDLSVYRYPQWHPQTRIERVKHDIPLAVQRAQLVLTDSEATKLEVMKEFSLTTDQVCAVPLGVDDTYYPRSSQEIAPTLAKLGLQYNAYSLFVSTIEPRKNLINLLAAYGQLPIAVRQRWPLVLVGSPGWQGDDIHQAIEVAKKEYWLIYLGFTEQKLLPILYAGCRLFTYPSWYEGFGLPIAEAMASGVPVLTSNCSSMPEVAAGAAMLVEPGDVESIRLGLSLALEDESWRKEAVLRGLVRAKELSWDACAQGTIAAYKIAQAR